MFIKGQFWTSLAPIRAEKQEVDLYSGDDPTIKELASILLFQDRFQRAFQRALRDLPKLQKDRRALAEKAAAEKAAAEKAAAEEAAARKANEPKHPPIPARFRDTKDENGDEMRVVEVPGQVWNPSYDCYDLVFRSKLKYPEKLRSLFSTFVREAENPTPEPMTAQRSSTHGAPFDPAPVVTTGAAGFWGTAGPLSASPRSFSTAAVVLVQSLGFWREA